MANAAYDTGTATIAVGETIATFQSSGALASAVRIGDFFGTHVGQPIAIETVDSDTQITLKYPWPGPGQSTEPYEIRSQFDGLLGLPERVRLLVEKIEQGILPDLAEVDPLISSLMGFDASGAFVQRDISGIISSLFTNPVNSSILGFAEDGTLAQRTANDTRTFLDLIKQTNSTDATSGRLLTPGAFGLGGNVVTLPNGHNANNDIPTGFYYLSSPANSPEGNGWLLHQKLNAQYVVQKFWAVTTGYEWKRVKINNIWQSWIRQEVIRGSNANGEFAQFPDGTQICTNASLSLSRLAGATVGTTWTFPSAFIASTSAISFSVNEVPPAGFREFSSRSTGGGTTATVIQMIQNGTWPDPTNLTCSVIAIGRYI